MNEQITLIAVTTEGDSFDCVTTKTAKTVFCAEESISQREFFEASVQGLKAELKLKLWTQDYNGEQTAEYNGRHYHIYRTYKRFDMTEIYLASEG